jgi:hypothetical protein
MSMSHKAYPFDWEAFQRELLPLLETALRTHDVEELIAFVHREPDAFSDPYEGEPLEEDWLSKLAPADEHQVGDFALTRYYRPRDDFGLLDDWMDIHPIVGEEASRCLLGSAIGLPDNYFDPGKYGSYFQDRDQVRRSLVVLKSEGDKVPAEYLEGLARVVAAGKGLYVTF